MFTREFDRRVYIALAALAAAGTLGIGFGVYTLWPSRVEAGYSPVQPLAFDHEIHAGTLKIDCLYCHSRATKGAQATVPPLSTCMNCHARVQPKDANGQLKPEIAELNRRWQNREPIEWIKVNDVADFVYFDHSRHLKAGLTCEGCHGPVAKMPQVRRQFGLKMTFCIDCHRQASPAPAAGATPTATAFPSAPEEDGGRPRPGLGTRAPTNCTTCHR